jgi:predicted transcriptional regulator
MMQTTRSGNQSRDRKGAVNGAAGDTALEQWHTPETDVPTAQRIVGRYRTAVETVAGYMGRAAALLEDLYAEQDGMIEQLKRLLSKSKSLRRSDFDAIFANLLARRLRTRKMLSTLVAGYRAHWEALIQEIEDLCAADAAQASEVWPALKKRLLDGQDPDEREIVAVLRQVHLEREELSTALSGLLSRGERLRISDLNTVVQRLASRDSRESAELAALLAACEAAGRNASMQWRMLAG